MPYNLLSIDFSACLSESYDVISHKKRNKKFSALIPALNAKFEACHLISFLSLTHEGLYLSILHFYKKVTFMTSSRFARFLWIKRLSSSSIAELFEGGGGGGGELCKW